MAREDRLRILCAADFHLGRDSSLFQEGSVGFDATSLGAWSRFCEVAVAERADAVLLAGDVFDDLVAAYQCRSGFTEGLKHLHQAGIPVVAVAGNHDHDAWVAVGEVEGLTLLGKGGQWETAQVRARNGEFSVVGWSFPSATYRGSPMALARPTPSCRPVVGLAHGDLDASASLYAPLSRSELRLAGYDAWVLGHVHKPQVDHEVPVAYPGSPQALDFGEMGVHGAVWLELGSRGAAFGPVVPLSTVQYEELDLEVDLEGMGGNVIPMVEERLRQVDLAMREGKDHLRSVQYRVRARLRDAGAAVSLPTEQSYFTNGSGYEVVSWARVTRRSLWEFAVQSDAIGQVARLLMGLRARDGRFEGREVDPDWMRSSARVLERCKEDVQKVFDDVHHLVDRREGYEQMTEVESWTRELVDARLSEALSAAELKEEQA